MSFEQKYPFLAPNLSIRTVYGMYFVIFVTAVEWSYLLAHTLPDRCCFKFYKTSILGQSRYGEINFENCFKSTFDFDYK